MVESLGYSIGWPWPDIQEKAYLHLLLGQKKMQTVTATSDFYYEQKSLE